MTKLYPHILTRFWGHIFAVAFPLTLSVAHVAAQERIYIEAALSSWGGHDVPEELYGFRSSQEAEDSLVCILNEADRTGVGDTSCLGVVQTPMAADTIRTLVFGVPGRGRLGAPPDDRAETWTFHATSGQTIEISVESDDIDMEISLALFSPDGELIGVDNVGDFAGDGLFVTHLSVSGRFQIEVSENDFVGLPKGGAYEVAVKLAEVAEHVPLKEPDAADLTVIRDCEQCPEMVMVPPGSFMMGTTVSDAGRYDDDQQPAHPVTIGYSLFVGAYEVTFAEWDACVAAGGCAGYRPDDEGWGRGSRPVINVSWEDAQEYVRWLSRETGEEYRLLSEAEWEYVARAGTTTPWYWGESELWQCRYANGNDGGRLNMDHGPVDCLDGYENTAPVGMYPANAFGLHDVLGNASEWTEDCWNRSYSGAPVDGSAWRSGDCSHRVVRGGSAREGPFALRSADRGAGPASAGESDFSVIRPARWSYRGFRVARTMHWEDLPLSERCPPGSACGELVPAARDEDSLVEAIARALELPTETFLAGVTRDDDGRIVGIDLRDSGARGPIPSELADLSELRTLNLSGNELTGRIPAELGNLTELRVLDLSTGENVHTVESGWVHSNATLPMRQRFLTGPIPAELGGLWELRELDLSGNFLTGLIPAELGNLRLDKLSLSQNRLTGPIPAELGNPVGSLELLDLSDNELSGPIPAELGNLRILQLLDLSNNGLSGSIPAELGNLRNLDLLDLSNNGLSGSIPAELGNLNGLESLALGSSWTLNHPVLNQLTGPIPAELGNLTELKSLDLSANQLTGPIPVEVGNLTELESLDLSANQLTGAIPAALGNLGSLRQLLLEENELTGPIPDLFGSLASLEELHLEGNELRGALPPLRVNTLLDLLVPPSVCIQPGQGAARDLVVSTIEWYRTGGVQGTGLDAYHPGLPIPPFCPPPPPPPLPEEEPSGGNVVAYTLPEQALAQSVLQAIRDDELAHVRTIDDGDVMEGTLSPTSPRYSDPWQAAFVFAAIKPGMTRISVDAEDDTVLRVGGPLSSIDWDADVIASDDDSGLGRNPAVTLMIRERGVYIIVLSAYEEADLRASFSYEISLSVSNREDE